MERYCGIFFLIGESLTLSHFAYHVSALGHNGIIVSGIENDKLGNEAINYIKAVGLTTDYIKVDKSRPTGTVEVNINDNNQPDYIIKKDVVWDFYNQKMY